MLAILKEQLNLLKCMNNDIHGIIKFFDQTASNVYFAQFANDRISKFVFGILNTVLFFFGLKVDSFAWRYFLTNYIIYTPLLQKVFTFVGNNIHEFIVSQNSMGFILVVFPIFFILLSLINLFLFSLNKICSLKSILSFIFLTNTFYWSLLPFFEFFVPEFHILFSFVFALAITSAMFYYKLLHDKSEFYNIFLCFLVTLSMFSWVKNLGFFGSFFFNFKDTLNNLLTMKISLLNNKQSILQIFTVSLFSFTSYFLRKFVFKKEISLEKSEIEAEAVETE